MNKGHDDHDDDIWYDNEEQKEEMILTVKTKNHLTMKMNMFNVEWDNRIRMYVEMEIKGSQFIWRPERDTNLSTLR
jgi:hypothetical protein